MRWLPSDMDEQRRWRLAKLKLHWTAVDDHVLAVSSAAVTAASTGGDKGCEYLLLARFALSLCLKLFGSSAALAAAVLLKSCQQEALATECLVGAACLSKHGCATAAVCL
jgi:hypothetical protein